jgi:Rieske Fe-S protein
VALNTPTPVAGAISGQTNLIAFSRVCTHQGCHVHLISDPEAGALLYNYRSETPFLGCPCHFGAYDTLQAGRPVFGPPQLPLPRIRLELRGEEIWATGREN